MSYPEIGSIVHYCRSMPDYSINVGHGRVQAIFLNTEKRVMVQVVDVLSPSDAFNVDLHMINADKEKQDLYAEVLKRVEALTNEGNEKVKELVADYNARVTAEYNLVLGAEVDFPDADNGNA